MNALNPVWPIGDQISEGDRVHRKIARTPRGSGRLPFLACGHFKAPNCASTIILTSGPVACYSALL